MTIEALTGSRAWLAAGWTMLHFLWVGGAIGLVAAMGRRALRGAVPEVRYGFALLCLAAMAVAPAAIVASLPASPRDEGPARRQPRATAIAPLPSRSVAMPDPGPGIVAPQPGAVARVGLRERWSLERSLETAAAVLPWLRMIGTLATFALLAAGLVGADRLRRRSRPLADGELAAMAHRLADALGIVRPIALGVCDRLATPILLGVIRPMILLPAAAVSGWGPEQIEMALLHELAHVRRLDNLVNLAQRVIESLLFFRPAVWWVSGWVRLEREHCCDRVVVARTGRARPYAELLAEPALYRDRPGRAAVAMAESPVVARIRCILKVEDHLMPLSRPVVALAAVLLVAPAVLIASRAAAPGPAKADASQKAGVDAGKPDRDRVDELIRRTRHGAEIFLNPQDRVYALTQIAGVQAQSGDREAARRTFEQAEKLAGTVSLDDATHSPHILLWIAQAEARHGFRGEAIAAARRLNRLADAPTKRESAAMNLYSNLIGAQMDLGDRAGVEETLRSARRVFTTSNDPLLVTYGPANFIACQAASGDLVGALRMTHDPELFRRVRPGSVTNIRHDALLHIVWAIRASNREGADQVLREALRVVAEAKYEQPWVTTVMKNQDLEQIAWAYSRLGRFAEALEVARTIDAENIPGGLAEDPRATFLDEQRFLKVEALASISRDEAKAGDRAGALRTAREAGRIAEAIEHDSNRYTPVWRAAGALAAAGDIRGARHLADMIDRDHRIGIYEDIAVAQRDAGDAEGARATLRAALDLARRRLDAFDAADRFREGDVNPERYRLVEGLARLQAKVGEWKQAIEGISQINNGNRRVEALKGVAIDLASAGDLGGALAVIDQMNSPQSEAEALSQATSVFSHRTEPPPTR